MRKSSYFIFGIGIMLTAVILISTEAMLSWGDNEKVVKSSKELTRELRLTDLCLFTEASYTRNPSLSDLYAPFQETPFSFEHFPSGALLLPSENIRRNHGWNY